MTVTQLITHNKKIKAYMILKGVVSKKAVYDSIFSFHLIVVWYEKTLLSFKYQQTRNWVKEYNYKLLWVCETAKIQCV